VDAAGDLTLPLEHLPAEIILEAAIDPLGGAALVVAHLLGKCVAGLAPAPRLPRQLAGRGPRAGLTEALVTGMRKVNERQTETNGIPANSTAAVP
jgi:hypothetical protein